MVVVKVSGLESGSGPASIFWCVLVEHTDHVQQDLIVRSNPDVLFDLGLKGQG